MLVLGIETSCDETGLALYDAQKGLIGHVLHSQIALHNTYGGVVPELASRDHIRKISPLLDKLLEQTKISPEEIDGIAYTSGPGLAGALLVGATYAKTLSYAWKKPAIAINHMEGHLLASMLEEDNKPNFPFLALLVSGGHTQLIEVKNLGEYILLGETLDDAAGEAFDKTAKLLNLGYPGGAIISKYASEGIPDRFTFPRPIINKHNLNFSFSGLKTHALNTVKKCKTLDEQTKKDIARAFEDAITDTLTIKTKKALMQTNLKTLVISGGVGANLKLREKINVMCKEINVQVFYPKIEFCTDNGAMIALAGCLRLKNNFKDNNYKINVQPRWPIASELEQNASADSLI